MTQYKRLAPLGGGVELVNVGPQVRRVFEFSGLIEILVVRGKSAGDPREISLEGLPFLSEGVFGEVFRLDDETVVKLYRDGEPVVIDTGDFSRGSPLFDLGLVETIYSPAVGICERVTKLPNDLGADFLTRFLDHYFAGRPDELASFKVDRAFYASLRLLHSIRLLEAIPDFRQQLMGVLRDRLIPAMREGGVR